jgi:hypothetical protein
LTDAADIGVLLQQLFTMQEPQEWELTGLLLLLLAKGVCCV